MRLEAVEPRRNVHTLLLDAVKLTLAYGTANRLGCDYHGDALAGGMVRGPARHLASLLIRPMLPRSNTCEHVWRPCAAAAQRAVGMPPDLLKALPGYDPDV
jgi:hypothetical protein